MIYLFFAIIIFYLFLGYIRLGEKFNMYSVPVRRSSHLRQTLTGGGLVLFPVIVFCVFNNSKSPQWIIFGLIICGIVSFLDDIYTVNPKLRLIIQFLSSCLLVFSVIPDNLSYFLIFVIIIIVISWLNAYNFMDGINGMATIYALVSLASFFYINLEINFINDLSLKLISLTLLIFGYFNFRKVAVLFLGDIGSVSIAFLLFYIMITLIIHTSNIFYIIMFSIFGIDSFFTIVERFFRREKLTTAHRSHLYQLLANEFEYGHLKISLLYGFLQLSVNFLLLKYMFEYKIFSLYSFFLILFLLSLIYISIKIIVLNKIKIK